MSKSVDSMSTSNLLLPTRSSLRLKERAEKQEVKPELSSNDRKRVAESGHQEEQDLEEPHQDDQIENDYDDKQETSSALTPSRRSKRNRNVRTRFLVSLQKDHFSRHCFTFYLIVTGNSTKRHSRNLLSSS